MKEKILNNLHDPGKLEEMYRNNRSAFRKAFHLLYPDISQHPTAQVWYERLNYGKEEIDWGFRNEWFLVIILSILAGLVAKIPAFTGITEDFFYPRNIAFIVFPLLIAYFAWKQNSKLKKLVSVSIVVIASVFYINLLPDKLHSDTLILACLHLPLFLWFVLGYTYVGKDIRDHQKRLDFLKYNGDLVVITSLILAAGGLLTGITLGLFSLIDLEIEEFYFRNIAIWGIAASPIVGTYLVQNNPHLVGKVSPVIARVFTPLVLATLVIYLGAVIYTGKDPYNDREFLLVFNLLLVGVLAIIFFAVAETSQNAAGRAGRILLFALSAVTIIINGIALSAIVFRLSAWGITPNRLAVLGSNILILINLLMVTYRLFRSITQPGEIDRVIRSITGFLPVYGVWFMVVTFGFPFLFLFQ
ncbi:MAG TPA: hypothetical protein ENN63_01110 [Bacteroidetes bacterium]|nr:hypothetical protein [Bacteroidota bacterium]